MIEHSKFRYLADVAAHSMAALVQARQYTQQAALQRGLPAEFIGRVQALNERIDRQVNRLAVLQVTLEAAGARDEIFGKSFAAVWEEISREREAILVMLRDEEREHEQLVLAA